MSIEMIAAPGRIFKTYSFWLMLLLFVIDASHALLQTFADVHILTVTQLTVTNAILAAAAGIARFVQQQIAASGEEKAEMVERIAKLPTS